MADNYSFDITSAVDNQEVKNAVDQTIKEIRQRFDLKNTKSDVVLEKEEKEDCVIITSDDEYKLKVVVEVFQTKLVKRGVSLKALVYEKIESALGGTARQKVTIQQGISSDKAKEISKFLRDSKLKVQAQIQGGQLRVQGKDKDVLQDAIALVKSHDFGLDLQFVNYR